MQAIKFGNGIIMREEEIMVEYIKETLIPLVKDLSERVEQLENKVKELTEIINENNKSNLSNNK